MPLPMTPIEDSLSLHASRAQIQDIFDDLHTDAYRLNELLSSPLSPERYRYVKRLSSAVEVAQQLMAEIVMSNGHML